MLLGGITSFPIGKSLKLAGVGFVLAVISMGGYLAYNQYKNLTKHIVELSQDKAELSGENHTLKTIISTQDNNIRFLKDRITARNNRLTQQPPTKVGGFRMLTNRVETIQLPSPLSTLLFVFFLIHARYSPFPERDGMVDRLHSRLNPR